MAFDMPEEGQTEEEEEKKMARVIPKDELKSCGTGWLEFWDEDVTNRYTLYGCAWFDWKSIEVDEEERYDTGDVEPNEKYGVVSGWRMWDEKPTPEERKQTKWKECPEVTVRVLNSLIPSLESCIEEAKKNGSEVTLIFNRTAEKILDMLKTWLETHEEGEADD